MLVLSVGLAERERPIVRRFRQPGGLCNEKTTVVAKTHAAPDILVPRPPAGILRFIMQADPAVAYTLASTAPEVGTPAPATQHHSSQLKLAAPAANVDCPLMVAGVVSVGKVASIDWYQLFAEPSPEALARCAWLALNVVAPSVPTPTHGDPAALPPVARDSGRPAAPDGAAPVSRLMTLVSPPLTMELPSSWA